MLGMWRNVVRARTQKPPVRTRDGTVTPVTVVELVKRLDELDGQFVTQADNWWARASLTVRMLAEHAEGSLRNSEIFEGIETLSED